MKQYRATERCFVGGYLREPGEVVDFDGEPPPHLVPLDQPAKPVKVDPVKPAKPVKVDP